MEIKEKDSSILHQAHFNELTDEEKFNYAIGQIQNDLKTKTQEEIEDLIIEMYDIFMSDPRIMIFDRLEDVKPYCVGLSLAHYYKQKRGLIDSNGSIRLMPRMIFDPNIAADFKWMIEVGFSPEIPKDMNIPTNESREYIIPNYIHILAVIEYLHRENDKLKEATDTQIPVNPILQ